MALMWGHQRTLGRQVSCYVERHNRREPTLSCGLQSFALRGFLFISLITRKTHFILTNLTFALLKYMAVAFPFGNIPNR